MHPRSRVGPSEWVDPRLTGAVGDEPKVRVANSSANGRWSPPHLIHLLRLGILAATSYAVGVPELLCTRLTSVTCTPAVVVAGEDVICAVTLGILTSEADMSVAPIGATEQVNVLTRAGRLHNVSFATKMAGQAGVRVDHGWFSAKAVVQVVAAEPVSVDVTCLPNRVQAGAQVQCEVAPRDMLGNIAEVHRPTDAPAEYFAVMQLGSAADVVVHDTYVSFVAGAVGTSAGVRVSFKGMQVESTVQVL
jgi:hypothetical protein